MIDGGSKRCKASWRPRRTSPARCSCCRSASTAARHAGRPQQACGGPGSGSGRGRFLPVSATRWTVRGKSACRGCGKAGAERDRAQPPHRDHDAMAAGGDVGGTEWTPDMIAEIRRAREQLSARLAAFTAAERRVISRHRTLRRAAVPERLPYNNEPGARRCAASRGRAPRHRALLEAALSAAVILEHHDIRRCSSASNRSTASTM